MTSIRLTANNAGRGCFLIAIRDDGSYLLEFGIFGNMMRKSGGSNKCRKAAKAGGGIQVHASRGLMRMGA